MRCVLCGTRTTGGKLMWDHIVRRHPEIPAYCERERVLFCFTCWGVHSTAQLRAEGPCRMA